METAWLICSYGLITMGMVNAVIQLFANLIWCNKCPCRVPGPFDDGSQDSVYEGYTTAVSIVNTLCGLPSSILLVASGILCFTGPFLGILISSSITFILLAVIIIFAIFVAVKETEVDYVNWVINFGAQIVGLFLSLSLAVKCMVEMFNTIH